MSKNISLRTGDALIIVDVQNDFLPGGSLAVPQGDLVIAALNHYIELFKVKNLLIYATRDWHPANHISFVEQGGIWPPHCIAGTNGADFANALKLPGDIVIISKGDNAEIDAYSGFVKTVLNKLLKEASVDRVFIGGLATDYCVLNTAKDALKYQFKTFLLVDAIRAVNAIDGDGDIALQDMLNLGVISVTYTNIL